MPWEKNFDIEEAVEKAMNVFWKKGYEATSMADLTKNMGINKGSLYNAFGSKKALFDRALLQYDKNSRQKALTELSKLEDGYQAIQRLFDGLIEETQSDPENRGCLLVNTALELPLHEQDVKNMIKTAFDELETFLSEAIIRGQKIGSISKNVTPEQTAKSLLSMIIGLRVLARGTYDEENLQAIRNDALILIAK